MEPTNFKLIYAADPFKQKCIPNKDELSTIMTSIRQNKHLIIDISDKEYPYYYAGEILIQHFNEIKQSIGSERDSFTVVISCINLDEMNKWADLLYPFSPLVNYTPFEYCPSFRGKFIVYLKLDTCWLVRFPDMLILGAGLFNLTSASPWAADTALIGFKF